MSKEEKTQEVAIGKKEHHHHHHHHHHHNDDEDYEEVEVKSNSLPQEVSGDKKDHERKHKHKHKKDAKNEENEISIDVNADIPLSKKELRLVKKGKITLEELQERKKNGSKRKVEGAPGLHNNSKRTKYGVWIGNMSFDTQKLDLVTFFTTKTADLEVEEPKEQGEEDGEAEKTEKKCRILEQDIVRINMPSKGIRNRGFAYVDFTTASKLNAALSLSETNLNGRDLLIKKSDSYDGRPTRKFPVSHNPPSRILFVGNLPFDTTEDQLREQFMHCGEIVKIRMATFEDSGKCKGFAFLDFKDEEGPSKALEDRSCHRVGGRELRMEFGEDRSKRRVGGNRERAHDDNERGPRSDGRTGSYQNRKEEFRERDNNRPGRDERPEERNDSYNGRTREEDNHRSFDKGRGHMNGSNNFNGKRIRTRNEDLAPNKRVKSSIALANAQRENPAARPRGKKVKFD